jgi:4'-phosphopantetheinyl transferase EntD
MAEGKRREFGMIETLFPAGVHTLCLTDETDPESLYPEEAKCVENAVPSRRREFAQGRLCARRALSALGIRDFPLLAGKDRAPIWPEGIVGSITHCRGYCAVAVARGGKFSGLGIDVELAEPLGEELIPMVCLGTELDRLAESAESSRGTLAKLIFSAKESVFKCIYPSTGVFLEFHDCEIDLDETLDAFSALLKNPDLPAEYRKVLRGRFARDTHRLFTGIARSSSLESQ